MSNMVVRTNIFALNAHRNMKNVGMEQGRASNRLSSGFRINSAADDAAGLAISETMRAQIRGLDQASRNAQDGQAMLLTTEGGLEEIGNMLQRTRELVVQAANDTNTQNQRTMIEQEINQLGQEIASMQQRVEFNTNRVLSMGPAMRSDISFAVADIESDGTRVSDAFEMVDANRRSVAEAREMLATLDGRTTFDQLNSRQQALINRALAAVELDTVTGGVVTTVTTDIPENIAAVVPGTGEVTGVDLDAVRDMLAEATVARVEILSTLAAFRSAVGIDEAGAPLATPPATSWIATFEALSTAQAALDEALADAGLTFDAMWEQHLEIRDAIEDLVEAREAHEAATANVLAAYQALVDLNIFDNTAMVGVNYTQGDGFEYLDDLDLDQELAGLASFGAISEFVTTAMNAALSAADVFSVTSAGSLAQVYSTTSTALETARIALAAHMVTWEGTQAALEELSVWRSVYDEDYDQGALYAYTNAREDLMDAINSLNLDEGDPVPTGTVTAITGLLNDRDRDLADRTTTLNQVRAEMLSAAEIQFAEISNFARFEDEPSSGDFVAWFQVGANQNQGIQFDFESVSRTVSAAAAVVNLTGILVANPATGSGIGRGIEVSPLLAQIQSSLDDVNTVRANLGAVQNRMDYTMRSLDISSENLQDSESRVRNADVAREMMRFTMANVLQQAAVSMLSQANQLPNNLLQLLR